MLSTFIFNFLAIRGQEKNQFSSILSESLFQDLFLISTSDDFHLEKIQKTDMHLLVLEELPNLISINALTKVGVYGPESGLQSLGSSDWTPVQ